MEVLGLAWMFDDPEWATAPDFENEDEARALLGEAARGGARADARRVGGGLRGSARTSGPRCSAPRARCSITRRCVHNGHVARARRSEPSAHDAGSSRPLVRDVACATPARARAGARRSDEHDRRGARARSRAVARGRPRRATESRRRAAARRRDRARARPLVRGALRLCAARRPRRARHQDRAARRRADAPRHAVSRGRRASRSCRARRASRSISIGPRGATIVRRLARRADLVLMSYRARRRRAARRRLRVAARARIRASSTCTAPGYGVDGPCARQAGLRADDRCRERRGAAPGGPVDPARPRSHARARSSRRRSASTTRRRRRATRTAAPRSASRPRSCSGWWRASAPGAGRRC